MIPKKIHYIWLGGKRKDKLAEICLLTWKEKMPDYEFIEWNEKNLDLDKITQESKYFAECRKRNLYAFMADYLRIKILYEQGGIYIDTDVQSIKPLNTLIERDLILGYETYTAYKEVKLIGTGLIGAEKNNWFIGKIYEYYKNEIMYTDKYIITELITSIYEKLSDEEKQKVDVLPVEYFSPYDSGGIKVFSPELITENTYAIHWYSNSWGSFKKVMWLQVKHIKSPFKRGLATIKNWIEYKKIIKANKKIKIINKI